MISKLATYERVAKIDDGPRILKKAVVLHTAVSSATDLYSFWQSGAAGPGVGAHFYVNKAGNAFQYLDTDRYTGHAWAANPWTVGIETWDGGLVIPWNTAQLATIIAICKELGVPAQALKETPSDGVGYHRQYASWNQSGHTCPGDPRVAQVASVIIPGLKPTPPPSGGDMADFYDDFKKGDPSAAHAGAMAAFFNGVREQYRNVHEAEAFTAPTGTADIDKDTRAGFFFAQDLQKAASS